MVMMIIIKVPITWLYAVLDKQTGRGEKLSGCSLYVVDQPEEDHHHHHYHHHHHHQAHPVSPQKHQSLPLVRR